MTTPSLPDKTDEPTQNQPRTTLFIAAGILALVITMIVLHLTGIVG